MNPITIGIFVFACTFGSAMVGLWLRAKLPENHLSPDSQATVTVGAGLIATMTALVLGLVTASAKSEFDDLDTAVKQSAADILTLDRTLARYGPESKEIRVVLHDVVEDRVQLTWPRASSRPPELGESNTTRDAEGFVSLIRGLTPQSDDQRWLQSHALEKSEALLEARWVLFSSIGTSIPVPFLVVLVFWLIVTFASFGMFAPRNGTVIAMLFVCALSVASAIFLILELDGPFTGVIRISPAPMDYALARINQ